MNIWAKLDLVSGEWSVDTDSEGNWVFVHVGFSSDTVPVDIAGVTFEWSAEVDGEVVGSASHPKGGIVYVETVEPWVTNDMFYVAAGEQMDFTFTAVKDGVLYEGGAQVVSLPPPSPFPSWVWNGTVWEPPIPRPGDEYQWSEEEQRWVSWDELMGG